MTPPPPGFELVPYNLSAPAPPPGFEIEAKPEAMNFDEPDDVLLPKIRELTGPAREEAFNSWADKRVAKDGTSGFGGSPARGIPIIGGLLDEAAAGINAGLHSVVPALGWEYEEGLALQRARDRAWDSRNPIESALGQIGVGVITGAPLFSRIPQAASALGRAVQGLGIGAPLGAFESFTRGEGGLENRVDNAEAGAVLGGVIGGALPLAVSGAQAASRNLPPQVAARLPQFVTRQSADNIADDVLAANLRRAGKTPQEVQNYLDEGQRIATFNGANQNASRAQTSDMIADASNGTQRLTGSVYRAGGRGAEIINDALTNRQTGGINRYAARPADDIPRGQHEQIEDALQRSLLVRQGPTARGAERDIARTQSQNADQAYDAARQASEDFDLGPVLTAMQLRNFQYQEGPDRQILERALGQFRDPSRPGFRVANVENFDISKRQLDGMIDKSSGDLRRRLVQFKNELLNRVHLYDAQGRPTINAPYQAARDSFSRSADELEAVDLGRRALRENSEVSVETYAALDPAHRELFRRGLVESVREAQGRAAVTHDATKLFRQRRVQDLLRNVIPRSNRNGAQYADRPNRFGAYVDRLGRQGETKNTVLGNSKTAERVSDDAQFSSDALARFLSGGRSIANLGAEFIAAGVQRAFGYRADVAAALARRLVEANPNAQREILAQLAQANPRAARQFINTLPALPVATPAYETRGKE